MITLIGFATVISCGFLAILLRERSLIYCLAAFSPFVAASVFVMPSSDAALQPAFLVSITFLSVFGFRCIRQPHIVVPRELQITIALVLGFVLWLVLSFYFPLVLSLLGIHDIILFSPLYSSTNFAHELHSKQFTQTGYLLLFLITVVVLSFRMNEYRTMRKTLQILLIGGIFACLWAIGIQLIYTTFLGNEYPYQFFNNSKGVAQGYTQTIFGRGHPISRICSIGTEPSTFGFYLTLLLCFTFMLNLLKSYILPRWLQISAFWLFLCTTILTTSTTALLGVVTVFAVSLAMGIFGLLRYGFYKTELLGKTLKTLAILFIAIWLLFTAITLVLGIPFDAIVAIYQTVTTQKMGLGSGTSRMTDFYKGVQTFLDSNMMGTGWGSNRFPDVGMNLLANVGVIGFFLFFLPVVLSLARVPGICKALSRDGQAEAAAVGVAVSTTVIAGFFLMFFSVSDFVFTYFWIFLAILYALPHLRPLPQCGAVCHPSGIINHKG